MDVGTRIKEIPILPKNVRGTYGMFWNNEQHRLELRDDNHLKCWIARAMLFSVGKMDDDDIKSLIVGSLQPMQSLMADFFFPGWRFNYYLKHGKSAEGI